MPHFGTIGGWPALCISFPSGTHQIEQPRLSLFSGNKNWLGSRNPIPGGFLLSLSYPAVGLSGDMIFAWQEGFEFDLVLLYHHTISLMIYDSPVMQPQALSFIHCLVEWSQKAASWETLSELGEWFWRSLGDCTGLQCCVGSAGETRWSVSGFFFNGWAGINSCLALVWLTWVLWVLHSHGAMVGRALEG